MVEKIYCDNGHLIGEMTEQGLFIQHHRRRVGVIRAKKEVITVYIQCDRCGNEKKITLMTQNTVDI